MVTRTAVYTERIRHRLWTSDKSRNGSCLSNCDVDVFVIMQKQAEDHAHQYVCIVYYYCSQHARARPHAP